MDLGRIESIVGADGLALGPAGFAVSGVAPAAVAAPRTREEAAALINLAREEGWALTPCGGGTQIDFGWPPSRLDLALSTSRLNRVVDYQPDDMTVTVEPGVTLAEIQTLLAGRGQFLPLNPPFPERTTAGGLMASAASGPWRAQYGTPRDWIIGCRVVGSDGKEIRGGGQVVKNVAGYDLPKLYAGSFGTLGLITEVTFKVMPSPPAVMGGRVAVDGPGQLERLIAAIQDSDLQPASFELRAVEGWEVLLEFRHTPEALDWQLAHLAELCMRIGGAFTRLEAKMAEVLLGLAGHRAAFSPFQARLTTVSSEVARLAAAVSEASAQVADTQLNASLATGQVYLAGGQDSTESLATALRSAAAAANATCVFPRLPAALVGKVDPWGSVGPELLLMRGLKSTLDPSGMFSPGRFVGRI